MSRVPLLALLLLTAALAPLGQAVAAREVEITPRAERAGDVLMFAVRGHEFAFRWSEGDFATGSSVSVEQVVNHTQRIVRVEGDARIVDRYGIERDAVSYRIERRADGDAFEGKRCHRLADGAQTIRVDQLFGMIGWSDTWTMTSFPGLGDIEGRRSESRANSGTLFVADPCEGASLLGGQTLREGGTITLEAVFGVGEEPSLPAQRATFHGRDALRYTWENGGRTVSALYAHDLPGPVNLTILGPDGWADPGAVGVELVGFQASEGALVAPVGPATIPDIDPSADPTPLAEMRVPDGALDMVFPSRDAIAAVRADPQSAAWLTRHPDAYVAMAWYEGDWTYAEAAHTDGGWNMLLLADGSALHVEVLRYTGVAAPGATFLLPQKVTTVRVFEQEWDDVPPFLALDGADDATIAAAAARAGVLPGEVRSFSWSRWSELAFVSLSNATMSERRDARVWNEAVVDAVNGGLLTALSYTTTTSASGILPGLTGEGVQGRSGPLAALAALAGPGVGVGLGVGAATSLALLVIAAKFLLVPLFTRLRRDKLLDNPVRARLYERVRAEPGIHRAELIDFAGIGEGATRHHLKQLADHRLVYEMVDGGFARYYAAGEVPPDVARKAAALRAGSHRAVYELYVAEPDLTLREAAARLGISAPSVHRAKKRLEKDGLLPAAPDLVEATR